MKITEESMKQQAAGEDSAPGRSEQPGLTFDTPVRTEREKFRAMGPKDRIWYVWAYYKFHMAAAIIAVFVIAVVGSAAYRSTFDTVLHCIYLNSRSETALNTGPLEQDFASHIGLSRKELITTETAFISLGDQATEFSYASMAKISALVASKELDILIGDVESTKHYASLNAFVDLESPETGLSPDVLALVQDSLYYAPGEDGVPRAYAIDLSGTAFAQESDLAQDIPLFGIIANSERKDMVESLIRYIFAP